MPSPPSSDHAPVALVTGGGTGIGAATAAELVRLGHRVVVCGRRAVPLKAVVDATGAHSFVADVADDAQARAAVAHCVETFGRLDSVIANAGGHGYSRVGETSDAEWHSSLRANLDTAFVIARAGLDALVASHGSLVIVSSLAGLFAGPDVAGYTVGKHALIGLTRSLARDYGPRGVRVNTICPGWVRTPMADEEMDQFADAADLSGRTAAYERVTADVPLRRPAEPEEIASAITFLAGPGASYITGATLVADGGAHIVDVPTIPIGHTG